MMSDQNRAAGETGNTAGGAGPMTVWDAIRSRRDVREYQQRPIPAADLDQILEAGRPMDLNLTRPVPVYFTYITAWAEPAGGVQFRPDIYGRDGIHDLAERDSADGPAPPWTLAP